MDRLRGADGAHLYLESRTEHRHTIKIQVLDTSTAFEPQNIFAVKQTLEKGIAVVPPLHWRLVRVPFNIAHPLWAYQRQLDLDYHIRRAAVPAPGGPAEFAEVVSEIATTGLERDRPLWQMWLVEGLAGGRVAFVTKLHHALADGTASARILLDVMDQSPTETALGNDHPWPGNEPIPSRWTLLFDGLRDTLALFFGLPRLFARLARAGMTMRRRTAQHKPKSARLFSAPHTRFNRELTPHRWFTNVGLPIEDMKRVKTLLGGTFNDVYVALCSGSIRRYLDAKGELPRQPLVASIPVSIREPHEMRDYGNRISSWLVSLPTHLEDPLQRYEAVRASTSAARDAHENGDPGLYDAMQQHWWIYRLFDFSVRVFRKLTGKPHMHVIISNVRGPSAPLYTGGARIVELQSMGPLIDGVGLNFTGWSYVDTLSVGIVACREHVPDVAKLADGVRDELRLLLDAAEKKASSGVPDEA